MSIRKYHKLVRDRIPEIIETNGKRCICSALSDEEYLAKLDEKLNEELAEYQESKSMEELADLLKVMRAVALARAAPWRKWSGSGPGRLRSAAGLRKESCWKRFLRKRMINLQHNTGEKSEMIWKAGIFT